MVDPLLDSQVADQRTRHKLLPAHMMFHPAPIHGLLVKGVHLKEIGLLTKPQLNPARQEHQVTLSLKFPPFLTKFICLYMRSDYICLA